MDVPVYKLDLVDNSCHYERNKYAKNAKSLLYKDSTDSVLFSQESQLNTSTTSIDKNETFWQSLRNLWQKKDNDNEVNLRNASGVHLKISKIMGILTDVENNLKAVNIKINEIENVMKQHGDVKFKSAKEVLKTIQNLKRKSEKTNIKCANIFSLMQSLNGDISNEIGSFQVLTENFGSRDSSNELSNNLTSEILMKFQSILQNILSDISAEILMQWNDVLFNIYSNSSKSNKIKTNKCKIVDFPKSPGNFLINTLRRSERLQNKVESESLSFNKNEIMLIKGKGIKNNANKRNQRKISTREYIKKVDNISHKTIPIKRSFEIFKYYEENRSDTELNEKLKNTGKRNKTRILSVNEDHDGVTSNYDSEADLVSLRKLFDC